MMMIVMHDYGFNSEAMVMIMTTLNGLRRYPHCSKIMITLRTSAISHHSLIIMIVVILMMVMTIVLMLIRMMMIGNDEDDNDDDNGF
jgi:cytochrome bd-type quinol oxidase subunit 2